ncbi:PAS domain-containing sensor histidine kinase [Ferrovibrio sp.]|uniref:PAS domain-containing sensor histidine kinase n=1 Tax=Ferrovibrio sp. TaxID=1917215 RepID=UPI00311FAD83
MILLTIAVTAVAAPLMVGLVCLFAYRNLGGGGHLLFWAAGHVALVLPFGILGFTDWIADPVWYSVLAATAGSLTFMVMLVTGIRVLTGHQDSMTTALLLSLALTACVSLVQQTSDLMYFGAANFVTGAGLLYGGSLLLRHRRSLLYSATGILLLGRGILAVFYAVQLMHMADLNATLAFSVFANLLTALGLIMIEFDNARQREVRAREDEHQARLFSETLIDAMPATMTFKDHDLRYRMINRRMRDIMPADLVNVIGRTWSEVVGPEAAAAVEQEDRRILASGETIHMEQGWAGRDGRQLIIWAMKVPLRDADGRVQGIITCGVDITRLKETEAQLIEQREAAESANRTKTAFLANMSHELRTPLNAIIGFSEMLAAGYLGNMSERQRDYAISIRQSGEHLLQLVSDILDLSRLETGRLELEIETCAFDEIAAAALAMVGPQAAAGSIGLSFSPSHLAVRADRRALTQILVNLLGNAVKYNRKGGSVTLAAVIEDRVMRLSVHDTGIGMTEAETRAAMAAFQRIDAYRSHSNSGAGLGLSICRSLVERHGGHMQIRSRPGHGTTVDVMLPA